MILIKLLIAGSRTIREFDLTDYVPSNTTLIISGGAQGIDSIAEQFANEYRISKLILLPRYNLFGKAAPLKRNETMIDFADEVLVIWDGISRGTKYTIDYARKKKKPLTIVICK